MISPDKMQKLWNLSDTVIYQEAVTFIRRFVNEQGYNPLPTSQIQGLLIKARSNSYSQLNDFIDHQSQRDWPPKQRNVKQFYIELGKFFKELGAKRVRQQFHLLEDDLKPQALQQQFDKIMLLIAHEFIQHLIAENNLLAQEKEGQQKKNNNQQRNNQQQRNNNTHQNYRNQSDFRR